jgi:hypothetical protein
MLQVVFLSHWHACVPLITSLARLSYPSFPVAMLRGLTVLVFTPLDNGKSQFLPLYLFVAGI